MIMNSEDLTWDFSKVSVDKAELEKTLKELQWTFPNQIITTSYVYNILYLKGIALQNYEKGGHWAIETYDLLDCDRDGFPKNNCFAYYLHGYSGGKLRKAVRHLASDCIMQESYAKDISDTAF